MPRSTKRSLLAAVILVLAAGVTGCGVHWGGKPDYASTNPLLRPGEQIFNQRCGGCHTFDRAGTEGSAVKANSREFKDGPNFNVRKEQYDAVLYAIRNGGFSSGPMPQNIVLGHDAQVVACFVATYSGTKAPKVPTPTVQTNSTTPTGNSTDCLQTLGGK